VHGVEAAPKRVRLLGGLPPLLPELAELMAPAPALTDRLASEFAPTAATLSTPQAYWDALNGWMTDRLSGLVLEGTLNADDISEAAWAIYASSYWGGMELREHWGMPPALNNLGMTPPSPPFADVQQGVIVLMTQRLQAVRAGGDHCLQL
jgi:hypothetical protein